MIRNVSPANRTDVAVIEVGGIFAQCPACGETKFRRRRGGRNGDDDPTLVYTCVACGNASSRLELVNQIGDEAMRRARGAFDSLKKKRRKPKKSPGA